MTHTSGVLHPVAIGQIMLNFAARYGVDADTCLLGTGVAPEQFQDAETLISREQEMRLIENLMLALPDRPALGFELGLQYNLSTFGIWGFALRTSRTVREAVRQALPYLALSTAYCEIRTIEEQDCFGLQFIPDRIPAHLRQFLLERDMATCFNLVREIGLSGFSIYRLELAGDAPPHAARIADLCGIEPCYHSARNAGLMRTEDVDRPLPMYDPVLVRMLEEQCRAQLARRQVAGISGRVRELLLGRLGLVASLEDLARELATSPRNLRRKLEQEGTTFRQIVEDERRSLAEQLLLSTPMKLDELAIQLGYTDTASFTRAFRRWFGQSPGEYRRQHARS